MPVVDQAPACRQRASAIRYRRVRTADGARLHAGISGIPIGQAPGWDDASDEAGVTVVLSHGWTLSGLSWERQRSALAADGLRVITYDQRGHGQSSRGSTTQLTVDLLGEDLWRVISELAPTGPLVLGGHSMGGMTVMALAAAHPELFADRVAAVVFVATSDGRLDPRGSASYRTGEHPWRSRAIEALPWAVDFTHRHERSINRLLRTVPAAAETAALQGLLGPGATRAMRRESTALVRDTTARDTLDFLPALLGHDKTAALAGLADVAVWVLVGDHDKLTPRRHADSICAQLPQAHLDVVEGAGHMLMIEAPDLVTGRLAEAAALASG